MPGKLFKTVQGATKELYIPCTCVSGGGVMGSYGNYPVASLATINDCTYISFRVPYDYNSIVVASVLVIPRSTQANAEWSILSNYAQTGEGYQTHSESDIVSTYNVTDNQIFEVNVADILTSLVANDIVGIKFGLSNSAHDVDVLGVRFKYL